MKIREAISPRELARNLRRYETEAERELWRYLRGRRLAGYKFYRQHPIGDYIVDFCCHKPPLVVELDGNPHLSRFNEDRDRTKDINSRGYEVLRFWNAEVLRETPIVLSKLIQTLIRIEDTPV